METITNRETYGSRLFVAAIILLMFLTACKGPAVESSTASTPSSPANVSANKDDYPVFPDADAAADLSVPAEQGGRGFKGEGWETNTDFDLIGDPRAQRGGVFREYASLAPGTYRMEGPEWNNAINYAIGNMMYEGLLALDPNTLKYMPVLATHWQISPDKLTFRFRINPNARWSDGEPVVADDVIRTWILYSDPSLQSPSTYSQMIKLEMPVAESKYIVRIKAKDVQWVNFENVATMRIFPGHVIKSMTGASYLKDYNFKFLPGTGPYTAETTDIDKGNSVTVHRRKDYWAEKARANVGLNNFDQVKWSIIRDATLAFEKLKAGDLDYFYVNRSRTWAMEMNFDKVQRGLIEKRKVFSNYPSGFGGFPMNTRRQPFDDIRVRTAFALLLDRKQMLEKLFYNEYLPDNSYYPGTIYENPDNPKNEYNPEEALRLLVDAGWNERDAQGRLTKAGKPLIVEFLYEDKQLETYLTVYQGDLQKLGITLNLRLVTSETHFKLLMNRQYDMSVEAWSASIFPSPEVEFHSRLADPNNTNNITGIKIPRVDDLIDRYNKEFDLQRRVKLIREMDGILAKDYQYVLQWYRPSQRLAYWNKFGQPRGTLTRIGDAISDILLGPGIEQLWWIDPVKLQRLEKARQDPSLRLETPPVEDHYWQEFAKTESRKSQ
jgi:microcin C transport system substrate-binding protein